MLIIFLNSSNAHHAVPTFLYGAAHEEGMKHDSIGRTFGYFKPNSNENQWIGVPKSHTSPLKPYSGPSQVTPAKGVVVIGATNWVDNYNIPLLSSDISAVRRIAKRISGRGGGLASVQAMALTHGEGIIEVACNLLDPKNVGGERVQQEIENLAREEGISMEKGYYTDFSLEEIVKISSIMQNEMSYHQ
jgi:glutamate formiminotransferase